MAHLTNEGGPVVLKAKDFATDQDVRWCPGCGDYSILKQVQSVLAAAGKNKDETVFISGIGCSSRFPYYMETYGMHSIHGRAPAARAVRIRCRPQSGPLSISRIELERLPLPQNAPPRDEAVAYPR